jgi:drug/metabolite transporter (DMT)-like permease
MLLAGVTFVSCDSFLKLLLRDIPPLQTLVLRGIMATLCCFLLITVMGQLKQLPKALDLWTLFRSLAEVVAVTAFIFALAHVPIADITAIYQIAPLLVLAGASFIWKEHVGALRWLLIGLGLAGALVVAQPGRDGASVYALLGLITAAASAARDLLSRRARKDSPGLVVTFNVVVAVMAVSFVNSRIFENWVPVTTAQWLYALGAGFFVTLGHLFVFLSFRHASARSGAPFYYSFTLFAVVFGASLFGEIPNAMAIAGIAMIIVCGLGVLVLERERAVA